MKLDRVDVIECLRAAAKEHSEVVTLLITLRSSLLIDGSGNKEIMADGDDLAYLTAVLMAADFVAYDAEKKVR
jgi:hypothetical protein